MMMSPPLQLAPLLLVSYSPSLAFTSGAISLCLFKLTPLIPACKSL